MNRAEIRENVFKLLFCNEFNEKKDMPKQYELFGITYITKMKQ